MNDITFLDADAPSASASSSSGRVAGGSSNGASVVQVPKKRQPTVADSLNFGAKQQQQQQPLQYAAVVGGKAKLTQPSRFSPAIEAAMAQVRSITLH